MSEQYFATVRWTPEDVMAKADDLEIPMTREEAVAWLQKNGKHVADRMVERGWEAIETMLEYDFTDKDKVECKFCHKMVDDNLVHRHSGGYVCPDCWDERLRATE